MSLFFLDVINVLVLIDFINFYVLIAQMKIKDSMQKL